MIRWDDLLEPGPVLARPVKPALHCECGRYAKWLGDEHYYNGSFDCYRYTLLCSRCGEVTIECV
jgi:hypothetical protein